MKISKLLIVFLALPCISALAQDPEPFALFVPEIRCELLVVRLPAAQAVALQKELRDVKTIGKGIEKLLALIEKNQAELVDWPTLTTRSGNRAVAENFREVRYPVEFEMPQAVSPNPPNPDAQEVPEPTAPAPAPAAQANPAGAEKPAEKSKPKALPDKVVYAFAGPTSFETKNVGVSLEIEPTVSEDGEDIAINVAPQHVSLLGYRKEVFELKNQYEMVIQQPIFDVQKVQTSTKLKSGQSQLLGFYKVAEPKNTVELQILTVTMLEAPPKRPTPPSAPPAGSAPAPDVRILPPAPVPVPGQ